MVGAKTSRQDKRRAVAPLRFPRRHVSAEGHFRTQTNGLLLGFRIDMNKFDKNTANNDGIFIKPGRGDMIRTCDILLPKQALYQTELRPETFGYYINIFVNCKM